MSDIIEVNKLTKKYKDFTAVDDISFTVKQGEIFGFLGPNGAGKTTTIKILTTLLQPTAGEIKVNGHDILKNKDKVRSDFGIVFQDPSLDDELTVYENMRFHAVLYGIPKKTWTKDIEKLLKFVKLWDRKDNLVKTFSGGMKRRLEIARGFLHHPKILFLDEPTLGLDVQTRRHVWEYVDNLNKKEGVTVFLTTHYIEEAEKVADRVAIIDRGKIVSQGAVSDIKQDLKVETLEDAFLKLTGKDIRDEAANPVDQLRARQKMMGGH